MSTQKQVDIKISFSQIDMQKKAFREVKENLIYILRQYNQIIWRVVVLAVKQGQIHNNLLEYMYKTARLSGAIEDIMEEINQQIEQWKDDFEEADEEFYAE